MKLNIKTVLSILFVAAFALMAAHARADVPDAQKMDKILQQQEQILKDLAELKEDVRIVKVRVSG